MSNQVYNYKDKYVNLPNQVKRASKVVFTYRTANQVVRFINKS